MQAHKKRFRTTSGTYCRLSIGLALAVSILQSISAELKQVRFERDSSFMPRSEDRADYGLTYPLSQSEGLTFILVHSFGRGSNVYAAFQEVRSRTPFTTGSRIDVFKVFPQLEKSHSIELDSSSRLSAFDGYAFDCETPADVAAKSQKNGSFRNEVKIVNLLTNEKHYYKLPAVIKKEWDVNERRGDNEIVLKRGSLEYFSPEIVILRNRLAVIRRYHLMDELYRPVARNFLDSRVTQNSSGSQCMIVDLIEQKVVADLSHADLSGRIKPSPSGNSFIAGTTIFSSTDGTPIWSLPQRFKSKWCIVEWLDGERVAIEGQEEGVLSKIAANLGAEESKLFGEKTASTYKKTEHIEVKVLSIVNLKTAEGITKAFPLRDRSERVNTPIAILGGKHIVSGSRIFSTDKLEEASKPVPFDLLKGRVRDTFVSGTVTVTPAGVFRLSEVGDSGYSF
jgi:hypothetical protein